MKALLRSFPIIAIAALLLTALFPAAVNATEQGIVLDKGTFSGGIPRGFTGSADLRPCEYNRYSKDGMHYQHIYSGENDRCDNHTTGAPKKGDVSVYRRYSVAPGEYYKAWAQTRMINPHGAVSQVKLILRDLQESPPGVGECYGKTDSTEFVSINTGETPIGIGNYKDRPPQMSPTGGCKIPPGVDNLALHFRVRAREIGAYGKAVLDHLRFGRCGDDGDCGNIPAP